MCVKNEIQHGMNPLDAYSNLFPFLAYFCTLHKDGMMKNKQTVLIKVWDSETFRLMLSLLYLQQEK